MINHVFSRQTDTPVYV